MAQPLRIGVLSTLYGPFTALGQDGLRGVELAVEEFGNSAGGRPIELCPEATIGSPDMAEQKARTLVEETGVDFIVGPLSGNEGLAVRNYARSCPDRVFLNGSSGAQDLTFPKGASNFFNFSLNGVQVVAGLGKYVYEALGYRRVVTVGEDYSYPYAQIGGFMLDFYQAGGQVLAKHWVPLGKTDYRDIISEIPNEADAVLVALGGTDAINFLTQYYEAGKRQPLFGGSITTDQSILSAGGMAEDLEGLVAGGPTADDYPDPLWKEFVAAYRNKFPDAFNYPSSFALQYYLNAKAGLLALNSVGGDLSDGQARLKAALGTLSFEGPCGPVRLDAYHGAIAHSFVTVVKKDQNGVLYRSMLDVAENVQQTMGLSEKDYSAYGIFSQDNPQN